ncbi:MAG: ABC transporter substrate-binding protein [Candidatus Buchananbacteria bacterium]
MQKSKKVTIAIIVAIITIVIIATVVVSAQKKQATSNIQKNVIKIGAILPMTGPSAIWGESIKQGMDLAQEDLSHDKIDIQLFYEDSQGKADQGITAYNKLNEIDNVDVFISALTNVSMPLIPLANKNQKTLIMTAVGVKNATQESRYVYRFFADDKVHALTHFKYKLNNFNYKSLGLLYVNSEYGQSVSQLIKDKAIESGIKIIAEESFMQNSTDYKTQLTKITANTPDAIIIIATSPVEIINSIKQAREMNIKSDIFEASFLLSMESTRTQLGNSANGAYTLAFPFTLGKAGSDFNHKFLNKYNKEAIFPAAYGYDMVKIISEAAKSAANGNITEAMQNISSYDSTNGTVTIDSNHNIIPKAFSVKIVDGQLVPVE